MNLTSWIAFLCKNLTTLPHLSFVYHLMSRILLIQLYDGLTLQLPNFRSSSIYLNTLSSMVESQTGAARKEKKSNLQCRASQFNNWVINQEGLEDTHSVNAYRFGIFRNNFNYSSWLISLYSTKFYSFRIEEKKP